MKPPDSTTAPVSAAMAPQRRKAMQDRSINRQSQIREGAIIAISRYGVSGVTHRRIAQEAAVSLAATTYYYETKTDVIADASRALLNRYIEAFTRFVDRNRDNRDPVTLRNFVIRLVLNAAGRNWIETRAWCEIILSSARRPELLDLSRAWFDSLTCIWREIASLLRTPDANRAVTSAIDTVIGFLFLIVPLHLSDADLTSLFDGLQITSSPSLADDETARVRRGRKAEVTRERILNAASEILIAEGADALTFRHVAEKAALTVAAPTYYFTTISKLLNAAQLRLFQDSKQRYRSVMKNVDHAALTIDKLVDLTVTIFVREATEFRAFSLACYPIYIESSRDPALRSGLWSINAEQHHRWMQTLSAIVPSATSFDAWTMYALFTGKLIRSLATGAGTSALSNVRGEFMHDLTALATGQHWTQT